MLRGQLVYTSHTGNFGIIKDAGNFLSVALRNHQYAVIGQHTSQELARATVNSFATMELVGVSFDSTQPTWNNFQPE